MIAGELNFAAADIIFKRIAGDHRQDSSGKTQKTAICRRQWIIPSAGKLRAFVLTDAERLNIRALSLPANCQLLLRGASVIISPDKGSHGDECQQNKHELTHKTPRLQHETLFEFLSQLSLDPELFSL
jgi:hypothetical protein